MKDFTWLVDKFTDLGIKLIPLLGIIAFLVFIIGVGRFIRTSGQSKEADKGMLTYGVGALFILMTIWGIIAFIGGEFFPNGSDVFIPQIHIN
jgi:hypothetical protein